MCSFNSWGFVVKHSNVNFFLVSLDVVIIFFRHVFQVFFIFECLCGQMGLFKKQTCQSNEL